MSKRARRGRATADVILLNGRVMLDGAAPTHPRAVALRKGKVLASGDDAAVLRHRGPTTRVIDLQGRTVVRRRRMVEVVRTRVRALANGEGPVGSERPTLPGLGNEARKEACATAVDRLAVLRRLRAMES